MKNHYSPPVIGVLGGGQLGRMLIRQALDLDVTVHCLDPDSKAPCANLAHHFHQGDFTDKETVLAFGRKTDIVTIEIENVNTEALEVLQSEGIKVRPSPALIRTIQDKGLQKQFFDKHNIPTAPFMLVEEGEGLTQHKIKFPLVQKLRREGYDGRGVKVLNTEKDIGDALAGPSVLEQKIDIKEELAIQVSRNAAGETALFPPAGMRFVEGANLLDYLYAPANIPASTLSEMQDIAVVLAEELDLVGILAIECFLDNNNKLWVNELAPRPHNSGHHTLQANYTSQYDQLLRSLLDFPPGETSLHHAAVMVNLLGDPDHEGPVKILGMKKALRIPRIFVNLYGKKNTRPYRKMGHMTILGKTSGEALEKARIVKELIKIQST